MTSWMSLAAMLVTLQREAKQEWSFQTPVLLIRTSPWRNSRPNFDFCFLRVRIWIHAIRKEDRLL